MSGYGPYSAEQIDALVERYSLPELVEAKCGFEDQHRTHPCEGVRTLAIIELHLVQHLISEHERRAAQIKSTGQRVAAGIDETANTAARSAEVMERGLHG